jgi:hypothetical protein
MRFPDLSPSVPLPLTAPLALTHIPTENETVGVAFSIPLSATGGVPPYTFSATGLPAGVTLGTVSLAAITAQTATVGVPFSLTLVATGGTAPYAYTSTALPFGLTLSGATISGTPTAAGTTTVTVTVTDSTTPSPTSASETFTITVTTTAVLPTVTGVSPLTGPTTGSTSVVITGTGFAGTTSVHFGTTAALSYVVNSSTSITAVSPAAGAAGAVYVTVTTAVGQSANASAGQFTYVAAAAPTVTSINPNTGPSSGATSVAIVGTNFTGTTAVKFGTIAAASFVVNSATSITAVSPAETGGVIVYVTNASGTNATSPTFTFTVPASPTVTNVSPNSGSISGGTSVTITGTNFTSPLVVSFGIDNATNVVVASTTTITCTSPAEAAAIVDVTVDTTAAGISATSAADNFTFTSTTTGLPFATALSTNRRYIVDQFQTPWLMVGDSTWNFMYLLTPTQMGSYFQTRQGQGFNCIMCGIFATPYIGGAANFQSQNGTLPFTGTVGSGNWITTYNPTYFNLVLNMVELAATYGFTVMLDPADTGQLLNTTQDLTTNSTAACVAYGNYLGTLFKGQKNVIWQSGNDYGSNPGDDGWVLGIAQGIAAEAPAQLQSVELLDEGGGNSANPVLSTDDANWPNAFPNTLYNGAYTYWSPYDLVLRGYNHSPVFPVWGQEYNYLGESNTEVFPDGTGQMIRAQAYWTMTCGATGQLMGDHLTWDASSWTQMQGALTDAAGVGMQFLATFYKNIAWYNLVPDQTSSFIVAQTGSAQGAEGDPATDTYCTGESDQ